MQRSEKEVLIKVEVICSRDCSDLQYGIGAKKITANHKHHS